MIDTKNPVNVFLILVCTVAVPSRSSLAEFDSFFDIYIEPGEGITNPISGPPYPTQSIGVCAIRNAGGDCDDSDRDYNILLQLDNVSTDGTGNPIELDVEARVLDHEPFVFYDIILRAASDGDDHEPFVFYDIILSVENPNDDGTPGGGPPTITSIGGDFTVDSFFDITYRIDLDNDGNSDATATLEGQLAPGLSFSTENGGSRVEYSGPDSFFDVFFDIHISDPVAFDLTQPMFTTFRLSGTVVPEPASVLLSMLGCVGLLGTRLRRRCACS